MKKLLKHVCQSGNDFEVLLPGAGAVRAGSCGDCDVRWERRPSSADQAECVQRITEAVLAIADPSVELLVIDSLPCEAGVFN